MPSSKGVSCSQPAESPARAGPEAIPTLSWGCLCEVQRLGDLSKVGSMSSRVEPRAQVSEAVEFPVLVGNRRCGRCQADGSGHLRPMLLTILHGHTSDGDLMGAPQHLEKAAAQ